MSYSGSETPAGTTENTPRAPVFRKLTLVCGFITALIGILGITGIYLNNHHLTGISPDFIPIAFSTAIFLIIIGVAQVALGTGRFPESGRSVFTLVLGFVFIMTSVGTIVSIGGGQSVIDDSFVKLADALFNSPTSHMSPVTAVLLALSSFALLLLLYSPHISKRFFHVADTIGILGFGISLVSITFVFSYLYGTPFLYGTSFIPVALTTAIATFFFGGGLVAATAPSAAPVVYFAGPSIRARLLRYFLPLTIALVITQNCLDWFLAWNLGISNVLVISICLVFFCLITAYAVFKAAEVLSLRVAREELLRKKAEETLRISEERYRGIFENMLNGFAYCRMIFENGKPSDFTYLVVNRAFGELTGLYGVEGRNVSEVIPGLRETDPKLLERYGEVAMTGVPARFEIFVESLMMWFSISVYSPRKGDFVAVFDVITERKAAEQDLKKTMGMLSRAQSIAHVGSWQYDVNKNIIEWSDELYRIFGILPGQFDLSLENIRSRIHPDDREKHDRIIAAAISTGHYDPEEYRIILPDGTFRYIAGYGDVETDETWGSVHIIGVVQDVTERRLAAEQREILIKSLEQKNAELERFTYTVSHDLKSPLITIRGFLGLLEEDAIKGNIPQLKTDIDRISSAADKMQTLLTDLLALSRIGRISNPPERVLFGTIVQEAEELLAGLLRKRAVTIEIAPDLPEVYVDRTRIREVLVNLIENAQKFMGDQPEPEIHIGMMQKDEEPAFFVKDNGVGIELQYQEKIFGLFEKLDARTEGSGIGLTIVKRIIEVHGGRIWVESDGEGKGTTVFFTLPVIGSKCIYNPAEGKNT